MPNIKLKDSVGLPITYNNINRITVPGAESGTFNYDYADGQIDITANGSYDVGMYATASVNVPGITPTGNIPLSSSNEDQTNIDVTDYATASISAMPAATMVENQGSISGSTYTQGNVEVTTAGYTSTGVKVTGATFANTATSEVTYKDISNTTAAPVLITQDYLYINKGYTDDVKISLAKLVPEGASADLASGDILSGKAAYNNDGNLIAGNIPTKTDSDITSSGGVVTVPAGYYAQQYQKQGDPSGDATLSSGDQMLSGITAYSKGTKYTGTIQSQAATTVIPKVTSQVGLTAGKYTSGDLTVGSIYTEVNSSSTMNSNLLDNNNVGKMYKFTGTTDASYTNGSLYICEQIPNHLCFTANTAGSTVSLTVTDTPTQGQSFQYSTDQITWNSYVPNTTGAITLPSIGSKVYFKATTTNSTLSESDYIYYKFVMTGSIAASGNIMSLLDQTCRSVVIPADKCFYSLFAECNSLTSAPELPATTLSKECYSNMFYDTYITTAPVLPATTLAEYCYYEMFSSCGLLATPPVLPATTLTEGCYGQMFKYCNSIITAPALPATTLAISCYKGMFLYCYYLTGAPVLPATTLAANCYHTMFSNCSSLETAPALPATTLANNCYSNMFYYCNSLTTPPALPATTLYSGCYASMFGECGSLYVGESMSASSGEEWRIPANGVGSGNYTMTNMFKNCMGERDTDSPNFHNTFATYYTTYTPVA